MTTTLLTIFWQKNKIVTATKLSLWKQGRLPQFEVMVAIAYELGGSMNPKNARKNLTKNTSKIGTNELVPIIFCKIINFLNIMFF